MGVLSRHKDSQWPEHSRKRVKITLRSELTENLEEAQRELFHDGKGKLTDGTIWCGARSWNVHSAVIASRCSFFKACSQGNFEESKTKTVYLDDDDPDAIGALLEYLYTLSSDAVRQYLARKKKPVVEHLVPLIRVADKYGQPLLLEQIYVILENPTENHLTTADMLRALSEIDSSIGTSVWITRMQDIIVTFLMSGVLDKVNTTAADAIRDYPAASCRLVQAMSKIIGKQTKILQDHPWIIAEDSDGDNLWPVVEQAR